MDTLQLDYNILNAEFTALKLNHESLKIDYNRIKQFNDRLIPKNTNELIHKMKDREFELLSMISELKSTQNTVIIRYNSIIIIMVIIIIAILLASF